MSCSVAWVKWCGLLIWRDGGGVNQDQQLALGGLCGFTGWCGVGVCGMGLGLVT